MPRATLWSMAMEAYLVALVLGALLLAGSLMMSRARAGGRLAAHPMGLALTVAGLVGIGLEGLGAGPGVTMGTAAGSGLAVGIVSRTTRRR